MNDKVYVFSPEGISVITGVGDVIVIDIGSRQEVSIYFKQTNSNTEPFTFLVDTENHPFPSDEETQTFFGKVLIAEKFEGLLGKRVSVTIQKQQGD